MKEKAERRQRNAERWGVLLLLAAMAATALMLARYGPIKDTGGPLYFCCEDGMAVPATEDGSGEGCNDSQRLVLGDRIDINRADKETLMLLPGIGDYYAEKIVQRREESGGFGSIDEVLAVPGLSSLGKDSIRRWAATR